MSLLITNEGQRYMILSTFGVKIHYTQSRNRISFLNKYCKEHRSESLILCCGQVQTNVYKLNRLAIPHFSDLQHVNKVLEFIPGNKNQNKHSKHKITTQISRHDIVSIKNYYTEKVCSRNILPVSQHPDEFQYFPFNFSKMLVQISANE